MNQTRLSLMAMLATAVPLAAAMSAGTVSDADRRFVAMVSQGGMFEVEAGKAGAELGSTQDIKDQGATEAHDHALVGAKLKFIAADAGLTMPASLNAMFQKKLAGLKALSGAAFDAAYLKDMEEIHAEDGAAFATEAVSGTNQALKDFATETHRIVVRHIGELKASGAA